MTSSFRQRLGSLRRGPSRPPRALPARDFLGRRAEAPPARHPFHFPAAGGAPGPGLGGRLGPPPPAHPPSSDPPRPPPSPSPAAGRALVPKSPRGAPTRVHASGAARPPAAGARRPPPAPAGHFGGRPVSLHLPARWRACTALFSTGQQGAPPGPLALKVGLTSKPQSHGCPWEGPALEWGCLGLLAFIPAAPSQGWESQNQRAPERTGAHRQVLGSHLCVHDTQLGGVDWTSPAWLPSPATRAPRCALPHSSHRCPGQLFSESHSHCGLPADLGQTPEGAAYIPTGTHSGHSTLTGPRHPARRTARPRKSKGKQKARFAEKF